MSVQRIRATALCIFHRGNEILVFEGYDPADDETFYRPLGGGIDFGERARDAVAREIREELGAEITHVQQLSVLENIFECDGLPGHQIMFIFAAEFADRSRYGQDSMPAVERGIGPNAPTDQFEAIWLDLSRVESGEKILYPEGLSDLIMGRG